MESGASTKVSNSSVALIIGMRGAGKTTLGREGACRLGFDFIDLDEHISRINDGKLPPQLVQEKGWPGFRELELKALQSAIASDVKRICPLVVACGGGIVETEKAVEVLCAHWPVVMVDRPIDDIVEYLERGKDQSHRASLGEHPKATYERRLPKFRECSDFEFMAPCNEAVANDVFARLLRHAFGLGSVHLGPDTFFISLTKPDYLQAEVDVLRAVASGSDVLELRVDLLDSLDHNYIREQVSALRSHVPGVPLLFTVRSKNEGGKFDGSEDEFCDLLRLGIRLGCELMDVECMRCPARIAEIVARRGRTLVVGSFHDFHRMPPLEELKQLFSSCALAGAAAIAKVVVKAGSRDDSWRIQEAAASSTPEGVAFIALCLGDEGRLSRVLNQVMTPVTHRSLAIAAPGQLSVDEILACRGTLSLRGSMRQFPLLAPWNSEEARFMPMAHTRAFEELGLPHICRVVHALCALEAQHILSLASVGGVSVAGPLCQELLPLVLHTEVAKAIGAVDVLVRQEDGTFLGDECGSAAIAAQIAPVLSAAASNCTGLVLGSGVDARRALHALQTLGFPSRLCCSTDDSSSQLGTVQPFGDWLQDFDSIGNLPRLDVIVFTEAMSNEGRIAVMQTVFERLKPIVVDAVARSTRSLVEQASASGCKVVLFSDVLLEQARVSTAKWTGQPSRRQAFAPA